MSAWSEVLAENEADAAAQMDEVCACGVRLGDHYDTRGGWVDCPPLTEGEIQQRWEMETKAQHTPGPWNVLEDDGDFHVVGPWTKGHAWTENTVATVRDGMAAEANARLIVAAPELLEALRGMLRLYGAEEWGGDETLQEVKDARAAIAKAEGRP